MPTITTWHDLLHPGDATDFFARRRLLPFDTVTEDYSPANALWLAELSRLIYRHDTEEDNPPPHPTRSSFLAHAGFRQLQFFNAPGTGTQSMLVESAGTPPYAVLVFRGTEQVLKDFITDIEIGLLSLAPNEFDVHAGFANALDSVWQAIVIALAQLTCPVFYTGHSLGAALATLAATRRVPQTVYTFGSPRVGNQALVDSLNGIPIYRVVDDRDIVATLPSEALGFRHAGTEHRLLEQNSQSGFTWLSCIFNPSKKLADHAPINYVDRI